LAAFFYFMKFILLAISIFFYLNCCSQNISGYIYDPEGNPLEFASVVIDSSSLGAATNSKGFYEFKNVGPGRHVISVSYLGYASQNKTVKVQGEKNTICNFNLARTSIISDPIIVRANRDEAGLVAVPARITMLPAKKIEQSAGTNISDVLGSIAGVDVKDDNGIYSSQTVVSLRGLGGDNQSGTLVLLDGNPVNKSDAGSVNWNMFEKDNIEKIEVVKGPGSVLFGNNAMGGIINIITKKPVKKLSLNTNLFYGTYNTFGGKISAMGRTDNSLFYWKMNAGFKKSDGYINTPDYIIKENDTIVVPVFLDEWNASITAGFQPTERSLVEISFNVYDDQRGRGVKIFEESGANSEHDTYYTLGKYRGKLKSTSVYLNIYNYHEDYNRLNEYYSMSEYKLYEVNSKRDDSGLKLWFESPFKKIFNLTYGAEIKAGSVDGADVYYSSTDVVTNKGKIELYGGFFQVKSKIIQNKLFLVSGIRYDLSRFHDALFSIENPSYSIEYLADYQFFDIPVETYGGFSPKFSLEYYLNDNLNGYASVGKGFRAPILEDLCRTGRKKIGFKIANPDLSSEYIMNYETGFNYSKKRIKTGVSVYFMSGKDFMYYLSTGDSVNLGYTIAPVFKMSNISKVEVKGLELEAEYSLPENFSVYANYTYNQSVIKEFVKTESGVDTDLSGKFLTDIPDHKYSFGANYKHKWISASISAKYTGTRWVNETNTIDYNYLRSAKYPAYTNYNFKIWKNIKELTLTFSIDNILNTIYTDSNGYRCPGRFMLFEAKYKFNK